MRGSHSPDNSQALRTRQLCGKGIGCNYNRGWAYLNAMVKDNGQTWCSKVLFKDGVQIHLSLASASATSLSARSFIKYKYWLLYIYIWLLAVDIILILLLTVNWLLTLYWLFTGPGWEIDPVLWVLQIFVRNRFGRKYLVEIFGLNRFGRYLFWSFWTNRPGCGDNIWIRPGGCVWDEAWGGGVAARLWVLQLVFNC